MFFLILLLTVGYFLANFERPVLGGIDDNIFASKNILHSLENSSRTHQVLTSLTSFAQNIEFNRRKRIKCGRKPKVRRKAGVRNKIRPSSELEKKT